MHTSLSLYIYIYIYIHIHYTIGAPLEAKTQRVEEAASVARLSHHVGSAQHEPRRLLSLSPSLSRSLHVHLSFWINTVESDTSDHDASSNITSLIVMVSGVCHCA